MMTDCNTTSASGRLARAALGLALALGAGGAAFAQSSAIDVNAATFSRSETRTRVLLVSGGDVATAEGRHKLDTRLRVAAGEVCGKFSTSPIRVPDDFTQCVDKALTGARAQLGTQTAMAAGSIRVSAN